MYDGKSEKYIVKLKVHRDPNSNTSDLYDFRILFFDHGKPEEFLLFVWNFNMTLAASGTPKTDAKIQFLCTIVCGEVLRQFYFLSADVKITETRNVGYVIKGLALYVSPANSLSKQKLAMHRGMKKCAV